MPRATKGQRFGGRQKGTPNKRLALQELLDAVFEKVDPVEKLVSLLNKPLDASTEARVLLRLMEYRYGQPSQNISLTGPMADYGNLSTSYFEQASDARTTDKPN